MKGWLKHISLGILLCATVMAAKGQRTVLAMPDDGGVWVRWTAPDLKSKNGINVYRQENGTGEWKLLNAQPFTYGQADISTLTAQNKDIKNAKEMADALRNQNQLEGIGLALVLTNAVESREFSSYLGIIYHDKTAVLGKDYRYEVKEVSGTGEVSYGTSATVKAGKQKPGAPLQEIKATAGDGKLAFSWRPEPERLAGAHIYYKLGGSNWTRMNKRIILPSKVPQSNGEKAYPEWLFLKDSLQNGTTYTCVVKGVDLFGFETETSQEFKLTPLDKTPPPAVSKAAYKVQEDKVIATWELPKAKGVEAIHVYRLKGMDTTWVKMNKQPLPPNATKYEDVVSEQGVTYTYSIATVDKAGNENRTVGQFVTVHDVKPPVQVRNLKAVADTGVIKLTWFPNPEKDLKGYLIYRMARTNAPGDTILITTSAIAGTSYNDTLPKVAKNTFVYFVKAVDTSYNSSVFSASAAAVMPDPEPPQTPTIKSIRKEAEALRLVWLPGMETDLAGYMVYRSNKETGPDSIWKPLMERPLGAKDTAYNDRSITPGQLYYYSVQALDHAGNRSGKSEPFSGNVTTVRLRAVPQDVEVKHGKGKPEATISWSLPPGSDVIGCMVYRKQGKDEFLPVSGLVQDFKVVDQGLKKGNTYYYEIRAFDKVGNYAKSAPISLTVEAD